MTQLAIDGGTPVRTAPWPRWPDPSAAEIAAATAVLESGRINYWTGDECRSFEREYAAALGRPHAIALANGTLALELALLAFGIGRNNEVIVPSRTFIATASAVVAVGAVPVVVDIDPDSGNMDIDAVAAAITPRTKAIIPVHLAGWPADVPALMRLAEPHNIVVIEDCAQAHGATLDGHEAGTMGHAAAFSFCQDKIITTAGEGGLLVMDDDFAYELAWAYKDHGKSLAKVEGRKPVPGASFKWLHDSFGTNWRMTEIQGAIGRVVLRALPDYLAARRRNASAFYKAIADVPGLRIPMPPASVEHAFYRFLAYVELDALAPGWDRDRIIDAVRAEGVPCFYGPCAEIYREQAFVATCMSPMSRLPVAQVIDATSLAFLVHPTMTEADVADMADAVRKVMEVATA